MRNRNRACMVLGGAVGAATLLVGARRRRWVLARQANEQTARALQQLPLPAESHVLGVGELSLHTVLAGPEDGPLVILLHGFPECWYSWRHQIPVLAEAGYRVATPDQRGYNLSDKPMGVPSYWLDHLTADLLGLIHALGRDRAIIVGHDWGGVVAWRLAMDYPEVVDRLVVMNAPHPVAFAKALRRDASQRLRSWYMFFFQLPWLPEALLTLSPRTTARFLFRRTAVRTDAFSEVDLETLATALAQPVAMRSMIHWYRAAFRTRPAKPVQRINAPTLLIWAEDDVALGTSLTRGLERWVANLNVHYIAHCGHWVQAEASDEVNAQLLAFLQPVPRGS
jgi:pimeloyl-ACP methyl ester carboxylesterase